MDRKSIIAFVAIYAIVASVGYFFAHRNHEVPAEPVIEQAEDGPVNE